MNNDNTLLSEILRPHCLTELTLSGDTIQAMQNMISSGSIMNMIFYGNPGTGKTSAARVLIKDFDADFIEVNGSFNNGDKGMVKRIEGFAYTASLINRPRICFIDEADYMPKAVQDPMRYIIENSSANCRFLMTANNIGGLTPALRSRCMPICYDIAKRDQASIIDRMTQQYSDKLSMNSIDLDQRKIYEIVSLYFPDFRAIANRFQMETFKLA